MTAPGQIVFGSTRRKISIIQYDIRVVTLYFYSFLHFTDTKIIDKKNVYYAWLESVFSKMN